MKTQTETAIELFEKGLTKSEIKEMANEVVGRVLDEGNPLKVAEALSAMESFIKEVKDNIGFKEYVMDEASKYPKGFVSNSGAKIEAYETGTKYSYEDCGSPIWHRLKGKYDEAKEKLSEQEKLLKTWPISGKPEIDEETGETSIVFPPAKSSISSYKITLMK